jgi:hypothetical protein
MGEPHKIDKHAALAKLVALRRSEESEKYFVLHKFDNGAWDFDHVAPWTKSARNVDAKLMIIGQDCASEKSLRDPKHNTPDRVALRKKLGQDPHLPTNKNLRRKHLQFTPPCIRKITDASSRSATAECAYKREWYGDLWRSSCWGAGSRFIRGHTGVEPIWQQLAARFRQLTSE